MWGIKLENMLSPIDLSYLQIFVGCWQSPQTSERFIQFFNGGVNKVLRHMLSGVSKDSQSGVVQKAMQVPSPIFGHNFQAYSTLPSITFFAHATSPPFLNFKAHPYIFPFCFCQKYIFTSYTYKCDRQCPNAKFI